MVPLGSPVVPEVKPSRATSSRPVFTAVNFTDLLERDAVELGIVVGGAVEADDLLQEAAVLGAGDDLIGDAAVGEGEA